MKLQLLRDDTRGSALVEFTVTLPVFLVMTFGLVQAGLLLWTQIGLQHGVEMAARCATINTTLCNNASNIQNFAAQQSYGLSPKPSNFAVSTPACGNQVKASYTFNLINYIFSLTLNAQSCYPI